MRILFLDDNENRHKVFQHVVKKKDTTEIDWAQTAEQAIEYLNNRPKYDIICLDHDLGEEHENISEANAEDTEYGEIMTGYDVAVFMVTELEEELQPPYAIVHTFNPHGAKRITSALNEGGIQKFIYVFPFSEDGFKRTIAHITEHNGF